MEQKQTLWIIAASGMFLLAVLGFAFIPYLQTQKRSATIAQTTPVQMTVPQYATGFVSNTGVNSGNQLLPPAQEIHTNDLTVYADNTVVYGKEIDGTTTIDLNALKAVTEMAPAQESAPQNINITVNIPDAKTETVSVPVSPVTEVPVQVVQADVKKTESVTVKPAVTAKNTSTAKVETKTVSTPVKTAETKVVEKKLDQYWVQAAAYSNKKTAENARTVLDDNKIPADIFTYQDAKGKVFYRVRVGPYTTKSEAEYWRTKIDKIAAFSKAESYITTN